MKKIKELQRKTGSCYARTILTTQGNFAASRHRKYPYISLAVWHLLLTLLFQQWQRSAAGRPHRHLGSSAAAPEHLLLHKTGRRKKRERIKYSEIKTMSEKAHVFFLAICIRLILPHPMQFLKMHGPVETKKRKLLGDTKAKSKEVFLPA